MSIPQSVSSGAIPFGGEFDQGSVSNPKVAHETIAAPSSRPGSDQPGQAIATSTDEETDGDHSPADSPLGRVSRLGGGRAVA